MRKLFFAFLLSLIAYSQAISQHEVKVNLGRSYSNSNDYSSFVNSLNYDEKITSGNKSIQYGLGYAYYVKPNIKIFSDIAFQQRGYSSWVIGYSGTVVSDSKYNYEYNYLASTLGVTYVFDMGVYVSIGMTSAMLRDASMEVASRVHFETDPMSSEESFISTDISGDCYSSVTMPSVGLGYQLGDLSLEITSSNIAVYGFSDEGPLAVFGAYGLNCVSIVAGYSKLIIR